MSISIQKQSDICPHCDQNSFALKHPLFRSENFWVVCDVHPLTEGHILIIPKKHISCVGDFANLFGEFEKLYNQILGFLKKKYLKVSSFEHGVVGQTVFHSHIHLLPYNGLPESIIPEGSNYYQPIFSLKDLIWEYQKNRQYLFFSIGDKKWLVDAELGKPRFFRDRFCSALGEVERGNWRTMRNNPELMRKANKEISNLKSRWLDFEKSRF